MLRLKNLDAPSRRLIFGTTVLAMSILSVPVFIAFTRTGQSDEMWRRKGVFTYRSEVVCIDRRDIVRTYNGYSSTDFNLRTGSFVKTASLKTLRRESSSLSPDGMTIVSVEPVMSTRTQIVIRNAVNLSVIRRVNLPVQSKNQFSSVHHVSSQYVVVSQWGEKEYVKGTCAVLDEPSKRVLSFPAADKYGYMAMFFQKGKDEYLGSVDGKNIQLYSPTSVNKRLDIDALDQPTDQRPVYGYFFPTAFVHPQGNRLFASVQFAKSLRGGEHETGSVYAWDLNTGKVVWRWQDTDVQPVALSLSPNGKLLAVGGTVYFPSTYERGARLLILDATTGQVKQEFFRSRGGSGSWQQALEKVRRTPDRLYPSGYDVPTVTGISWTVDSASIVAAYADDEIIRWRVRSH